MNKVIDGLECCLEGLCDGCGYRNSTGPGGCRDELMRDALNMLKEQERHTNANDERWIKIIRTNNPSAQPAHTTGFKGREDWMV